MRRREEPHVSRSPPRETVARKHKEHLPHKSRSDEHMHEDDLTFDIATTSSRSYAKSGAVVGGRAATAFVRGTLAFLCGGVHIIGGITTSQNASRTFTWGTVVVLPFYTLMVLAPNANITKRTVDLLYLSWTPDTLHAMFASKYWLPEVLLL